MIYIHLGHITFNSMSYKSSIYANSYLRQVLLTTTYTVLRKKYQTTVMFSNDSKMSI